MDPLGGLDVSGQLPEDEGEALHGRVPAAFIDDQIACESAGNFLTASCAAGGTDLIDQSRGTGAQGNDPFGVGFSNGDPEAETVFFGALQRKGVC
jgi:hypothetical protein